MALFRRQQTIPTAVAIVVFLALIVNQWSYVFRFHYRDSIWQPQLALQPDHHMDGYNATIQTIKQQRHQHIPDTIFVNEIIHRAFFGLGHRLHRSAAAYHLAQSLSLQKSPIPASRTDIADGDQIQQQPSITHLRFHWESCIANGDIGNSSLVDAESEEKKEYNVFRYLFGDDLWKLKNHDDTLPAVQKRQMEHIRVENHNPHIRRNMIILRNDIPGYIAGQLYKDLKLPVNFKPNRAFSATHESESLASNWVASPNKRSAYDAITDKVMRSDVDFYRRLVKNYRFRSELQEFQVKHQWNERPLVIGLHLRAGNGESAHFLESGRSSSLDADESVMISRLAHLVNMIATRETDQLWGPKAGRGHQEENVKQNHHLQPLLFVATDTAHLLPLIDKSLRLRAIKNENDLDEHSRSRSNETNTSNVNMTKPRQTTLELVTWPQEHLPRNAGVGFDALEGKGERCLEGWKAAMSDSLLLSEVDVLIAATRSTFTQSLPLALGFSRNNETYDYRDASTATSNVARETNNPGEKTQHSEEVLSGRNRSFSFCEVSEPNMTHVTCFMDAQTWLFRGEEDRYETSTKEASANNTKMNGKIWTLSIPYSTSSAFDEKQTRQQVEHKITVLLPDVSPPNEFEEAREFLRRENAHGSKSKADHGETYESIFRYGRSKINQKYRGIHRAFLKTNSSWNLINES